MARGPNGPDTKNECAGEDHQQFTGLHKYRPEMTSYFMIFRTGVMKIFFLFRRH
jgi:hypothetical protein